MILPIVAYGTQVLREVSQNITPEYPDLQKLIDNMWETMYASSGVGLAAPQINKPIRLFVVDSEQIINNLEEDETNAYPGDHGVKQVFINAKIVDTEGDEWAYQEGCLSIPKIREDVSRPEKLKIRYLDENFKQHERTFHGITARVIFHEYDHLEGKLFIDYLKPLKKRLLKGKLDDIAKGKIRVDYKMSFPR